MAVAVNIESGLNFAMLDYPLTYPERIPKNDKTP